MVDQTAVFDRYITIARGAIEGLIESFNETTACLVDEVNEATETMECIDVLLASHATDARQDAVDVLKADYDAACRTASEGSRAYHEIHTVLSDALASIHITLDEAYGQLDMPRGFVDPSVRIT